MEEEVNFINDFSLSLTKKIEEEKLKPQQYVKEATVKLNKLEEQIGKHFEHQKNENDKMTKEITELKGDTTSIEQSLIGSFKVTRGYCDWLNSLGNRIGVVTYIDGTGQASMNAN